MSTQTENIRGLYSGDAYVGQSDLRGDNSVAIEVLSLSANQVMFGNTFPASDYGNNPTVNLQTGRVLYRTNDAAIGANSYAIGVSHVYNSQCSRYASRIFRGISNGWKLNLQQAIVREKEPIGNGSYKQVTRYIDADGNTHEFKLYDSAGMRFYAEDDATNVLTETSTEYVLQDGLGNKFVFTKYTIDGVVVGLLSKSISCQNTSMVKYFEYDTHLRLVKVYDGRKKVGNNVKSFVELAYDDVTGLLSSTTAYDKFNKKLSVTRYEYVYDSLAKVYAVALNKAHQEVMTKAVTEFAYTNGKLTSVVDCETKSAMEFVYENNKIKSINYGVICGAPYVGQADSGNQVIESGSFAAKLSLTLFLCKKSQRYVYYNVSEQDKHTYRTDLYSSDIKGTPRLFGASAEAALVTKEGVTYAYYMNRCGEIVTKFEVRTTNSFYALEGDTGKEYQFYSGNRLDESINGCFVSSGSSIALTLSNYELTRNAIEKKSVMYEVRFNMRHAENCTRLNVKCHAVFETSEGKTEEIDSNVWIDGTATNCWQNVLLQFQMPSCPDNGAVYLKNINITVNKNNVPINFCWDCLRFSPSITSTIIFQEGNSLKFEDFYCQIGLYQDFVAIGSTNKKVVFDNTNIFLTEEDIQKTYSLAKRSNGTFDIIYNSGKCRACGITSLQAKNSFYNSIDNLFSKVLVALSETSGGVILQQSYFEKTKIRVVNSYLSDLKVKSTSEIAIDYVGNELYHIDEYGVRTENTYDVYGNLIEKRILSSDGVVATTDRYYYDEYGEKLLSQPVGDNVGEVTYNDFNLPIETTLYRDENNEHKVNGRTVNTDYSLFNDKVTRVTEYNGNDVVRQNTVTYQDGRVRSVSDGTITNGVEHDYVNDVVEYTEQQSNSTLLLRRDEISTNAAYSNFKSTYVDGGSGTEFTTVTDRYDRVVSATDVADTEKEFSYMYRNAPRSGFNNKLWVVTNDSNTNLCKRVYSFDADGNVTGWADNNGTHQMKVLQVSHGRTKYTFDNAEDIFTEIVYDDNVAQAPRVVSTAVLYEREQQYDRPKEHTSFTRKYTYDTLGNVLRVTDGLSNQGVDIGYSYSNVGGKIKLVGTNFEYVSEQNSNHYVYQAKFYYTNECAYKDGRITQHSEFWSGRPGGDFTLSTTFPSKRTYSYTYDRYGRLIKETSGWGTNRTFSYLNGRLSTIVDSSGTKKCTYANGRLQNMGGIVYYYDKYGNRTSDSTGNVYKYSHGNVLVYAKGTKYSYNHEGVRIGKTLSSGKKVCYYVDGNKILGEERDGIKLRYFYDATGICGLNINGTDYNLVKNTLGNVVAIVNSSSYFDAFVAMYTYDAWGNCTVRDNNGNEITDKSSPALINPFRWKSLYLDEETGLYYANGSFYDPKTALYVDAADISTVVDRALGGFCLDRTTLLCDNTLELDGLPHGAFTVTELTPDPTYDPNKGVPWYIAAWEWVVDVVRKVATWFRNIPRWFKITLGAVCLVAAIVITVLTEGNFLAAVPVLVEFAVSVGLGVFVSLLVAQILDPSTTEDAVLDALADGIMWGGIFAFVSAGANWLAAKLRSPSTAKSSASYSFDGDTKGVEIRRVSREDFTDEAWARIQSLKHKPDGSTVSSLKDGYFIHKGYKVDIPGKEGPVKGAWRADFLTDKIIYELKPNNANSIRRGIAQLHRYNNALDGAHKLILVVY